MSKHTPAPWKIHTDPKFPSLRVIQLSDGSEFEPHAVASREDEMANLRVAAAAPELLEVAKVVLFYLEDKDERIYDLLDNAIAKAEGRD